tara:strand:- start:2344 stop:2748 length:405 start_codon:yes stop_codon:yes gene_type:complete
MNKDIKNFPNEFADFLPKKETTYFKKMDNINCSQLISKEQIIEELKKVMDPEIPVNLYDLGLIYNIEIDPKNNVFIEMTLTNPNCPVAGTLPGDVGSAIEKISCLSSVKITLVWEPKWDKSMMSEDAKLALDIF